MQPPRQRGGRSRSSRSQVGAAPRTSETREGKPRVEPQQSRESERIGGTAAAIERLPGAQPGSQARPCRGCVAQGSAAATSPLWRRRPSVSSVTAATRLVKAVAAITAGRSPIAGLARAARRREIDFDEFLGLGEVARVERRPRAPPPPPRAQLGNSAGASRCARHADRPRLAQETCARLATIAERGADVTLLRRRQLLRPSSPVGTRRGTSTPRRAGRSRKPAVSVLRQLEEEPERPSLYRCDLRLHDRDAEARRARMRGPCKLEVSWDRGRERVAATTGRARQCGVALATRGTRRSRGCTAHCRQQDDAALQCEASGSIFIHPPDAAQGSALRHHPPSRPR